MGNHVMHIENGILRIFFKGRVSIDDAKILKTSILEAGDRFGILAALVDLDGLVDFDAGARALLVRPERPYPLDTVAYFGGSFTARMLIESANRAGRLIMPKAFAFAQRTFATEEEARRFLETAREKRTAAR